MFFTRKKLLNKYKKQYENIDSALNEKPRNCFCCLITPQTILMTAIKCAKANCNIFIEKPLSNNLTNILKLKKY